MFNGKIPYIDSSNPIPFFATFLATVSSLGCAAALNTPDGTINAIPNLEAAAKVKNENPYGDDHKALSGQKERKRDAERIIEAAGKLAGYIRTACGRDPAAQMLVNETTGMAGQDGIKALKALWEKFGPAARIAHTQKAYERYKHTDQSVGQFIISMDQFFVWHQLGGHMLTSKRKCEMALRKIKSEYRLTMLSTCAAYGYK
eukprot:g702.t1